MEYFIKKILRLQKWNSISSDTTFFNVLAETLFLRPQCRAAEFSLGPTQASKCHTDTKKIHPDFTARRLLYNYPSGTYI